MKKPEKKNFYLGDNGDHIELHNQAIDTYEKYHQQEIEKLNKIIFTLTTGGSERDFTSAIIEGKKLRIKVLEDKLSNLLSEEKIFILIKSNISDCICKIVNFLKCKIPETVLNLLANEYSDKIAKTISKRIRGK